MGEDSGNGTKCPAAARGAKVSGADSQGKTAARVAAV